MVGFDREILEAQIKEVFGQLVSSKLLNIEFPISGNIEPWAEFFWGHPDTCRENWAVPFVFFYGLDFSEDFDTICTDKMSVSMTIGVEADCKLIAGQESNFEGLWYKIRRVFGRNSGTWIIEGSFTLTNDDATITTFKDPKFSDFGIRNTEITGNSRVEINGGEKLRYSAVLSFDVYFNHVTPNLQ